MWMRNTGFLALAAALLVSGCSVGVTDKSSNYAYVYVPVGSKVVLHEDVRIQPGWSRVFIQNGEVVARNKVAEFYPYCNFEVGTLAVQGGDPLYIRAGAFETGTVHRRMVRYSDGQMVAQLFMDGDGRSNRTLNTEIMLSSETQPDVRRLICSVWGNPHDLGTWVTIDSMRETLGPLATFEIAD